jgi:hypothetical protein
MLDATATAFSNLATGARDIPRYTAGEHDHLGHCLDYSRQAIMCAADTTVEWLDSEEEGSMLAIGPTNGNGVEHKYRDWEAVLQICCRSPGHG